MPNPYASSLDLVSGDILGSTFSAIIIEYIRCHHQLLSAYLRSMIGQQVLPDSISLSKFTKNHC